MASKGKPDTAMKECDDRMWEHHCREAFSDLKAQLASIARSQEENREAAAAERKNNAVRITKLTAIVTNGLNSRVDRIDRRLWVILGAMLALAGAVVADMIRGG